LLFVNVGAANGCTADVLTPAREMVFAAQLPLV
jgi:hypothetical protein